MTRNTKTYKTKIKDQEIHYRTLNVTELHVINNMNNDFYKNETAAKISLLDEYDIEYAALQSIGKDVLLRSQIILYDSDLYKLTVDNFRNAIKQDETMILITKILQGIPGVSIEFLYSQTFTDLLELGCICEHLTNKSFFKFSQTMEIEQKNGTTFFKDDGKSLQEKIREAEKTRI